ncbi:hypothetical protein SAMN05720354_10613 [Nitrosospira sp. Nsp1]|nr:hypothetical protein SAMN05720354_10613 [Nitrosospira sp. Nsp1]
MKNQTSFPPRYVERAVHMVLEHRGEYSSGIYRGSVAKNKK